MFCSCLGSIPMMRIVRLILFVLMAWIVGALPARGQSSLAARVLVVFDPSSSDSVNVANHYLAARGIPSGNLCAVSPPEAATVLPWSRYVSTVQTPIQNCLNTLGANQILYIVFSYIRPFSLIAQNGKVYAMDSYVSDIWNQYAT